MDLKEKYPFIHSVFSESEVQGFSSNQLEVHRRNIWEHDKKLLIKARRYVANADVFLFSRLHDSEVLSAKLKGDCLTIRVDDDISNTCFHAANSLLGLGVPIKRIQDPVTIRIDGIRNLSAYGQTEEELVTIPVAGLLARLKRFQYDELSAIGRDSVSIGFVFYLKDWDKIVLDVEARTINFEKSSKENFTSLFGAENIDVFEALWQARENRTLGWDPDCAIKIIAALRPELPKGYDVQDYYVWRALDMRADDARKKGMLNEAIVIYQELIPSHWNRHSIWRKMSGCLFESERYSEAILYIHALLGYDQDDIDAHCLLAQTWHRLGATEDAADELEQCLKLKPNFKPAIQFIARHKKIRECMEKAAEYGQDNILH